MAWAFSDQGNGTAWTAGNLSAAAVNVASNDLIVVAVGTIHSEYCDGISDTQGNSYTVRSAVFSGTSDTNVVLAYCIGASANANNVVTATFSGVTAKRVNMVVSTFTPDGGETVTFDVATNKSGGWEALPWETDAGTADTTGTDEVCIVGVQAGTTTTTYTNHEIPSGTAATALTDPGSGFDSWYRILTSTVANLEAEIDPSAAQRFAIEMVCFKSVAAAGGLSIPIAMHHHKMQGQ